MTALSAQAMRTARLAGVPRQDEVLVLALCALLGFGTVLVYSASTALVGNGTVSTFYYLFRHVLHIALGVAVLLLLRRSPVSWWQASGGLWLAVAMFLLVLVLVPGLSGQINGSSRWLQVGPVNLQPSEFAKLAVVVYVAGYLTRRQDLLHRFSYGVLYVGVVVALVGALLMMEPDFGSLVVLTLTVSFMLFLAGSRIFHLFVCAMSAAITLVALVWTSPYRMQRVTGFLDPWSDPFDSGFQLVQALIAMGRGEWFGVGLGASVQKLYYLPAPNTDFLLAVIGEELGFVGVVSIMLLFAAIVWRALVIARRAETAGQVFGARLAQGIGLFIGLQALINMGVNMGALPTKGLTLPFLSYGGSSMLASCAAAGLLLAVDRESRHAGATSR